MKVRTTVYLYSKQKNREHNITNKFLRQEKHSCSSYSCCTVSVQLTLTAILMKKTGMRAEGGFKNVAKTDAELEFLHL